MTPRLNRYRRADGSAVPTSVSHETARGHLHPPLQAIPRFSDEVTQLASVLSNRFDQTSRQESRRYGTVPRTLERRYRLARTGRKCGVLKKRSTRRRCNPVHRSPATRASAPFSTTAKRWYPHRTTVTFDITLLWVIQRKRWLILTEETMSLTVLSPQYAQPDIAVASCCQRH